MLVPFFLSVVIQVMLLFRFKEGRKNDLVLNTTIAFVFLLNIMFFLHAFFGIVVDSPYIILAFSMVFFISVSFYIFSQFVKKLIKG
ncbi:hypothetical protein BH23BAC1_BH23BAC1_11220 [soil metagenome]